MDAKSMSDASLPLKLDDLGRPTAGARDWELERMSPEDEDSATEGTTDEAMAARYWMTFFVFSVFPAPDSPLSSCQSESRTQPVEES